MPTCDSGSQESLPPDLPSRSRKNRLRPATIGLIAKNLSQLPQQVIRADHSSKLSYAQKITCAKAPQSGTQPGHIMLEPIAAVSHQANDQHLVFSEIFFGARILAMVIPIILAKGSRAPCLPSRPNQHLSAFACSAERLSGRARAKRKKHPGSITTCVWEQTCQGLHELTFHV